MDESNLRASTDIFWSTCNEERKETTNEPELDLEHLKFQQQILKGKRARYFYKKKVRLRNDLSLPFPGKF